MHLGKTISRTLRPDGSLVEECTEGTVRTFAPFGNMLAEEKPEEKRELDHWRIHQHRQNVPRIAMTATGMRTLPPSLNWESLRHPEQFHGEEIGHGIEASVQKIRVEGKTLILKLFDEVGYERIRAKAEAIRAQLPLVDFLERLGFTAALKKVIDAIPVEKAPNITFDSLEEYAAAHIYHLMAEGPAMTWKHIETCFQSPEKADDAAMEFVASRGITPAEVQAVHNDIIAIEKLCALAAWSTIPPFGKNQTTDFSSENILVKDFDVKNRRIEAVLIDQGAARPFEDWPEWDVRTQYARQYYDECEAKPCMRQWLETNGIQRPSLF